MGHGYLTASLLTVLLASACAAPNRVAIPSRIEAHGFSDSQMLALYQAADDWSVATAGMVVFTDPAGVELPVSTGLEASDHSGVVDGKSVVIGVMGQTEVTGDHASISINVPEATSGLAQFPDMFRWVFEHELGHALGLHHEPGTLLEPVRLASGACVDADSLAKVCANYGGCNAGAHPTCESP